jgi:hypothetical protein
MNQNTIVAFPHKYCYKFLFEQKSSSQELNHQSKFLCGDSERINIADFYFPLQSKKDWQTLRFWYRPFFLKK